jgi:bifunctional non-homologous end joining protein LigD
VPAQKIKAAFIEPMLLLPTRELVEGASWTFEPKLDGYRAIAIKTDGRALLRSRNDKDFNSRYPAVVRALVSLPDETVIDGEVVALDESGRPSFNILQNHGSSGAPIIYYVFDVLILEGRDVMAEPLSVRRELLRTCVLLKLGEPIRHCPELNASLGQVIESVRTAGLEGLVAKRLDSTYEPGSRSGAWRKMRLNRGQEFVIGGYTLGASTFDALVFGYYEGDRLVYVGRTRSGFTQAVRAQLWRRFRGLEVVECPFVNLPEERSGRWGQGLTADKMKECRWLSPVLVAHFEYVEWTPDNHLRHSSFIALGENRDAPDVRKEC